ncbi:MAG: hypothetical protein OWU32_01715 [Firmicutes bacterium]|nr:hypothetical protein [Bacillota bacterium]
MSGFWPSLPFYIPYSPGMPSWWDLVWWVFQLIVMSLLLLWLHSTALREDRAALQETAHREGKRAGKGSQRGH